ncbi:hypothetical protein D9M69_649450 [compost metagenome]
MTSLPASVFSNSVAAALLAASGTAKPTMLMVLPSSLPPAAELQAPNASTPTSPTATALIDRFIAPIPHFGPASRAPGSSN